MASIREDYPEVLSIKSQFKFYDSETGRLTNTTDQRDINLDFYPHFNINCICWECVNGGHDLNMIIHTSIKERITDVTGSSICQGWQDRQRINRHRCNTRLEYFYSIEYID
ncbi:hypothetical protein [Paenibacillus sp. FSL H3-0333]|uniref:hypothetical protein n=1 Tax=Paenibacillus sp. FSL H3-0333 TaxID=2921373 RepID=UPI0030F74A15